MFPPENDDSIFHLIPTGNGYYHPRYPDPSPSSIIEESPGISIAERDQSVYLAVKKLRALKHVALIDW